MPEETEAEAPDQEEELESAQQALDLSAPEVVRGEVNLKRFGNVIFPHYRTKDLDKARSFSFPHTLADVKNVDPEDHHTTYTQPKKSLSSRDL